MHRLTYATIAFFCLAVLSPAQERSASVAGEWLYASVESNISKLSQIPNEMQNFDDISWHFVVMFNSTNSGSKSAYTNFSKSAILNFLVKVKERSEESGLQHRFSIYPFQLDLYGPPRALEDVPLDAKGLVRFDEAFPTTRFDVRGDGITPYPGRGHNNSSSRRQLALLLGPPDGETPTLIIQVTDIAINEDPEAENDDLVRRSGGWSSELEGTGFVVYEVPGQPFVAGPVGTEQDIHFWLYGPDSLANARSVPVKTNDSPLDTAPLVIGLATLAALAVAGFGLYKSGILRHGAKTVSVRIEGMPYVPLKTGEFRSVVGNGGEAAQGSLPKHDLADPNLPEGEIFQIAMSRSGPILVKKLGDVEIGGTTDLALKPGENIVFYRRDVELRKIVVEVGSEASR